MDADNEDPPIYTQAAVKQFLDYSFEMDDEFQVSIPFCH